MTVIPAILAIFLLAQIGFSCQQKLFDGLAYSPWRNSFDCNTATPQSTDRDIKMLANLTNMIRTYEFSCQNGRNGIAVIESTRKYKVKLLFGLRMSNDPSVFATQTNLLESYLRKRPSLSHLVGISVGNEVLFANMMSESDLIARIKHIRKLLNKYGYKKVKVTTSDVITKYSKRLVDNVDFVVMNLHTYYAGQDVKAAANRILPNLIRKAKSISGEKQLIIGETGWPSGGAKINNAIPSLKNLEYYAAKTSCIANRLRVRYFYFEAFNANWKSQTGIEHNWGIATSDRKLKINLGKVSARSCLASK